MRHLSGALAVAFAVTLVPQPASANHLVWCAEGYELICAVIDRTEGLVCRDPIACG